MFGALHGVTLRGHHHTEIPGGDTFVAALLRMGNLG